MDFTSGAAVDGQYSVTKLNDNEFTVLESDGANPSATISSGSTCTFGARYSLGINIGGSNDIKNVLVGNVIDAGTIITPISNSGPNTSTNNNITD